MLPSWHPATCLFLPVMWLKGHLVLWLSPDLVLSCHCSMIMGWICHDIAYFYRHSPTGRHRLLPFPSLPFVVLVSDTVGIPCASHSRQGSSGEVGLLQFPATLPPRLPSSFSLDLWTLAGSKPTWIPSMAQLCFWWGPLPGLLSLPSCHVQILSTSWEALLGLRPLLERLRTLCFLVWNFPRGLSLYSEVCLVVLFWILSPMRTGIESSWILLGAYWACGSFPCVWEEHGSWRTQTLPSWVCRDGPKAPAASFLLWWLISPPLVPNGPWMCSWNEKNGI